MNVPAERPPCLVVTTGRAWGSLLGMVRALSGHGVPVWLVGLGVDLSPITLGRSPCSTVTLPFDGDLAAAAAALSAWWRREGGGARAVLFPMSDKAVTLAVEHREALEELCAVCAPRREVALQALDKERARELAAAHGLDVPWSAIVRTRDELAAVAARAPFPAIVKPTWWRGEGERTFKTLRCDRPDTLLHRCAALLDGGATLLVQQFIPGGDDAILVYLFYRSVDGASLWDCTGRKIRQEPPGAGIMAAGRAEPLREVAERSRAFLRAVDYRGVGGIEYKRSDGRDWFIEVSVRPEGFHPLARGAGVDLIWAAYRDLAGISPPGPAPRQGEALWVDEMAYLGIALRGGDRLGHAREALRLMRGEHAVPALWRSDDALPLLAVLWDLVAGRLRRRRSTP